MEIRKKEARVLMATKLIDLIAMKLSSVFF